VRGPVAMRPVTLSAFWLRGGTCCSARVVSRLNAPDGARCFLTGLDQDVENIKVWGS